MGTIGYMSPEQLAAKPLTPATEHLLLRLLVLFEMLQGQMPFKRDSNMEVIASILRDEPVTRDAAKPLPPHHADRLSSDAWKRIRLRRFQHGGEVADALRGLKYIKPIPTPLRRAGFRRCWSRPPCSSSSAWWQSCQGRHRARQ